MPNPRSHSPGSSSLRPRSPAPPVPDTASRDAWNVGPDSALTGADPGKRGGGTRGDNRPHRHRAAAGPWRSVQTRGTEDSKDPLRFRAPGSCHPDERRSSEVTSATHQAQALREARPFAGTPPTEALAPPKTPHPQLPPRGFLEVQLDHPASPTPRGLQASSCKFCPLRTQGLLRVGAGWSVPEPRRAQAQFCRQISMAAR